MSLQTRIVKIEDRLGVGVCPECDPMNRTLVITDDVPDPGPVCPACSRP